MDELFKDALKQAIEQTKKNIILKRLLVVSISINIALLLILGVVL